jgi:hypothetical protein
LLSKLLADCWRLIAALYGLEFSAFSGQLSAFGFWLLVFSFFCLSGFNHPLFLRIFSAFS